MTGTVSYALRTCGRLSAAGLLALGCGNLLGIHDPVTRAPDADGGEAGEPSTNHAGKSSGGMSGESEAGASGDAGHGGGDAGANGGESPLGVAGAGTGGISGAGAGGGGTGGAGNGGADVGGGGTGGAPACSSAGPLRCDPASPKTPQMCSSEGEWLLNATQNNGMDCGVACNDGVCGECTNGDTSCKDNYARTCINGAWVKPQFSCPDVCVKGACVGAASCGAASSPGSCNQESCCLSLEVTGNTFFRDNKTAYPATVSSFSMDKYEVTVARLKQYMSWYFGPEGSAPLAGAGKSAHFAPDPGWNPNYPLPARTAQGMQDMQDMLGCVTTHGDPVDANATYPLSNPLLPANCVTFYVAYALCIWDGGRLPSEAEWNFAATSSEQRTYPWSNPPSSTLIDASYAVYGNNPIQIVGSLSNGRGPFGQFDLSGNVSEWTLDYFASQYPAAVAQCTDCISLGSTTERSVRGGSFSNAAPFVKTSSRGSLAPESSRNYLGFRCVHDL